MNTYRKVCEVVKATNRIENKTSKQMTLHNKDQELTFSKNVWVATLFYDDRFRKLH